MVFGKVLNDISKDISRRLSVFGQQSLTPETLLSMFSIPYKLKFCATTARHPLLEQDKSSGCLHVEDTMTFSNGNKNCSGKNE